MTSDTAVKARRLLSGGRVAIQRADGEQVWAIVSYVQTLRQK